MKPKGSLIFGVGKLDVHPVFVGGKKIRAFRVWHGMLKRCYGKGSSYRPSYDGCVVDEEWHLFSAFKNFYDENYLPGFELDKDLLFPGNKVYSGKTCIFIPQALNSFVTSGDAMRGDYPIGVCLKKGSTKFQAGIKVNGKNKHLGMFHDPYLAHLAWFNEKMSLARGYKSLCDQLHPFLYSGLIKKIESLKVSQQACQNQNAPLRGKY
ncbi:hypothetical protein ACE3J1_10200 [Enterobacter hormaechei subsp. steigerwaltii]